MIERTLILVKPDGVQRHLVGEVISRFEKAGLKIVGMKMVWCDKEHAMKHYTEDITVRRGEHVRNKLLRFLVVGPVVALCLEVEEDLFKSKATQNKFIGVQTIEFVK